LDHYIIDKGNIRTLHIVEFNINGMKQELLTYLQCQNKRYTT